MFKFLTGRLLIVRIILLLAALALVGIGIAAIYAVGNPDQGGAAGDSDELAGHWQKQIQYAIVAVIGFLAVNFINYRRFGAVSYAMYAVILALLAMLLLDNFVDIPFVPVVNGTRRWIRVGLAGRQISLQPSEFCKLIYLLALAWYLRYRSNYRNFTALVGPFVLTLVPMMLIVAEPDLGTVLLMMPILFAMLFVAGAKVRHLLIIIVMAAVTSPIMWFVMKPYQRARISSVILQSPGIRAAAQEHPKITTALLGRTFSEKQWESHWGYHLIRSKFAVASGGTTGYGFRKGPFVKYNFLPARHNDFIFAVIAHQWGFWGSMGVLALYVIIVACGLEIAVNNTDPFGRLLAAGIVAMFVVEVLVNISMTLGLMPITGLTLPLVSYGGSSLITRLNIR